MTGPRRTVVDIMAMVDRYARDFPDMIPDATAARDEIEEALHDLAAGDTPTVRQLADRMGHTGAPRVSVVARLLYGRRITLDTVLTAEQAREITATLPNYLEDSESGPSTEDRHVPRLVVCLTALTDDPNTVSPDEAVQFAVRDADGLSVVYGDQEWVASGRVISDAHPDGTLHRRDIELSYGPWVEHIPATI